MINSYQTKLVEKKRLANDVYLFKFALINPSTINFIPGQYMMLRIAGKPRLYSIASSANNKNFFELIIELIPGGLGSQYLKKLSLNDKVIFQGPAGMFHFKNEKKDNIFLATGTGIAPIRSMINSISNLADLNKKIYLFWGLKYYQDVYLFDEWQKIEKRTKGNFHFLYCLSREKDLSMIKEEERKYFFLGHIQDALNHCFNNLSLSSFNFYLCGGRLMIEDLRNFLIEKGVGKEKIIFERF